MITRIIINKLNSYREKSAYYMDKSIGWKQWVNRKTKYIIIIIIKPSIFQYYGQLSPNMTTVIIP
jgi:hypothetical protein